MPTITREYELRYHCKQCRKRFGRRYTATEQMMVLDLTTILAIHHKQEPNTVHHCNDRSVGLAYMVGIRLPDKNERFNNRGNYIDPEKGPGHDVPEDHADD